MSSRKKEAATGQNYSMDTSGSMSRIGVNSAVKATRLIFDKSQIIFSASKGETANNVQSESKLSVIDTQREDDKDIMGLSELDFSELQQQSDDQQKPIGHSRNPYSYREHH